MLLDSGMTQGSSFQFFKYGDQTQCSKKWGEVWFEIRDIQDCEGDIQDSGKPRTSANITSFINIHTYCNVIYICVCNALCKY